MLQSVQRATVRPHVAGRLIASAASLSCRANPTTGTAAHVMPVRSVPTLAGRTTVHRMVHRAVQAALHAARNRAAMAAGHRATPAMLVRASVPTAIAKVQAASAWMASSAASVSTATVPAAARPSEPQELEHERAAAPRARRLPVVRDGFRSEKNFGTGTTRSGVVPLTNCRASCRRLSQWSEF